jgi:hypothetical protein
MQSSLTYSSTEIESLRANYQRMSIWQLESLLGRPAGGIVQRLKKLESSHPEEYDKARISELLSQFNKKAVNGRFVRQLREYYMDYYLTPTSNPFQLLKDETGEKEGKIIAELRRLAEEEPSRWNSARIDELGRWYDSEKEKEEAKAHIDIKVYQRMLKRERKWTERDTQILGAVYLTHNWLELAKIFRYKSVEAHLKLRELHRKEPGSWDLDRVVELEEESLAHSIIDIRSYAGYYAPTYHTKATVRGNVRRRVTLPRKPEIDALIENGLNEAQIAERVKVSSQAINQYIKRRNLGEIYQIIKSAREKVRL